MDTRAELHIEVMANKMRNQLVAIIQGNSAFEQEAIDAFNQSMLEDGRYRIHPGDSVLINNAKALINILTSIDELLPILLAGYKSFTQSQQQGDTMLGGGITAAWDMGVATLGKVDTIKRFAEVEVAEFVFYLEQFKSALAALPGIDNQYSSIVMKLENELSAIVEPIVNALKVTYRAAVPSSTVELIQAQKMTNASATTNVTQKKMGWKNRILGKVKTFTSTEHKKEQQDEKSSKKENNIEEVKQAIQKIDGNLQILIQELNKKIEENKDQKDNIISVETLQSVANTAKSFSEKLKRVSAIIDGKVFDAEIGKTIQELGAAIVALQKIYDAGLKESIKNLDKDKLGGTIKNMIIEAQSIILLVARWMEVLEVNFRMRNEFADTKFKEICEAYEKLAAEYDINLTQRYPYLEQKLQVREEEAEKKNQEYNDLKSIREEIEKISINENTSLHTLLNVVVRTEVIRSPSAQKFRENIEEIIEDRIGIKLLQAEIKSLEEKIKPGMDAELQSLKNLYRLRDEIDEKLEQALSNPSAEEFYYDTEKKGIVSGRKAISAGTVLGNISIIDNDIVEKAKQSTDELIISAQRDSKRLDEKVDEIWLQVSNHSSLSDEQLALYKKIKNIQPGDLYTMSIRDLLELHQKLPEIAGSRYKEIIKTCVEERTGLSRIKDDPSVTQNLSLHEVNELQKIMLELYGNGEHSNKTSVQSRLDTLNGEMKSIESDIERRNTEIKNLSGSNIPIDIKPDVLQERINFMDGFRSKLLDSINSITDAEISKINELLKIDLKNNTDYKAMKSKREGLFSAAFYSLADRITNNNLINLFDTEINNAKELKERISERDKIIADRENKIAPTKITTYTYRGTHIADWDNAKHDMMKGIRQPHVNEVLSSVQTNQVVQKNDNVLLEKVPSDATLIKDNPASKTETDEELLKRLEDEQADQIAISIEKAKSFILKDIATAFLQRNEFDELQKSEPNGSRVIKVEDTLLVKNLKSILNILSLVEEFAKHMQDKIKEIQSADLMDSIPIMFELYPYVQQKIGYLVREQRDFIYYVSLFQGILPDQISQLFEMSQAMLPSIESLQEVKSFEDLSEITDKLIDKSIIDKMTGTYVEIQNAINVDVPVKVKIVAEKGKLADVLKFIPSINNKVDHQHVEINLLNKPIAILANWIAVNPNHPKKRELNKIIKSLTQLQKLMQELANLSENNNWTSYPKIAVKIVKLGVAISKLKDAELPGEIKVEVVSVIENYQLYIARACAGPEMIANRIGIQSDKLENEMKNVFEEFESLAKRFDVSLTASYANERIKNFKSEIVRLDVEKEKLQQFKSIMMSINEIDSLEKMPLKTLQQLRDILKVVPPSTTIYLQNAIDRIMSERTGLTLLDVKIGVFKEEQANLEKQLEIINKHSLILSTQLKNVNNEDEKLASTLIKLGSSEAGDSGKSLTMDEFNLIFRLYSEKENAILKLTAGHTRDTYISSVMDDAAKKNELMTWMRQARAEYSNQREQLNTAISDNKRNSAPISATLNIVVARLNELEMIKVALQQKVQHLTDADVAIETKFSFNAGTNTIDNDREYVSPTNEEKSKTANAIRPEESKNIVDYLELSIARVEKASQNMSEKIKIIEKNIALQTVDAVLPVAAADVVMPQASMSQTTISQEDQDVIQPSQVYDKDKAMNELKQQLKLLEQQLKLNPDVLTSLVTDKNYQDLQSPEALIQAMIKDADKTRYSKIYAKSVSFSDRSISVRDNPYNQIFRVKLLAKGKSRFQRFKSFFNIELLEKHTHDNIYLVSSYFLKENNYSNYRNLSVTQENVSLQKNHTTTAGLYDTFSVHGLHNNSDNVDHPKNPIVPGNNVDEELKKINIKITAILDHYTIDRTTGLSSWKFSKISIALIDLKNILERTNNIAAVESKLTSIEKENSKNALSSLFGMNNSFEKMLKDVRSIIDESKVSVESASVNDDRASLPQHSLK